MDLAPWLGGVTSFASFRHRHPRRTSAVSTSRPARGKVGDLVHDKLPASVGASDITASLIVTGSYRRIRFHRVAIFGRRLRNLDPCLEFNFHHSKASRHPL